MDTFSKIASFLAGTCSPEEKMELEAWRRTKPENEQEFRRLEKVWQVAAEPASFRPDLDSAWQKVNARISGATQDTSRQEKRLRPQQEQPQPQPRQEGKKISLFANGWWMAAAVALLLLFPTLFFLLKQEESSPAYAGLSNLHTSSAERQSLLLADGTQVWLNRNSSIHYPEVFEEAVRKVYLEGEAYFEVAHNPDKPFIINAGEAAVQVLGTSFNLRNREAVNLQVLSGSVKITASKATEPASMILEAGQGASFKEGKLSQAAADPNVLSWKTGRFVFKDSSLKEVVKALENYYPVKFQAADPGLWQCRLYAEFDQEPLEEVLQVLSLTLNLKFEQQPDQNHIVFSAIGQGCLPIN